MKQRLVVGAACLWGVAACRTPSVASADAPLDTRAENTLPTLTLAGDWPVDQGGVGLWQAAARGDEWSTLELARVVGPGGLLRGLESGGPQAQAAAQAWAHVPTAWHFRGEWCRHALRYQAPDWAVLLRALSESATQRDAVGEALESQAQAPCERWMTLAASQVSGAGAAQFGAVRDALDAAQMALSPVNVFRQP